MCHLLQPTVRQIDKIFALGAVAIPRFLLAKVVCGVVVLEYIILSISIYVVVLDFLVHYWEEAFHIS